MPELSSNINISSNIYPRKTEFSKAILLNRDPAFVRQVRGRTALQLTSRYCNTTSAASFSPMQMKELNEDTTCVHDKLGEQTHGMVQEGDELVWRCRCENRDCPSFHQCRPEEEISQREISTPILEEEVEEDIEEEAVAAPIVQAILPERLPDLTQRSMGYTPLSHLDAILTGDLSERVLLDTVYSEGIYLYPFQRVIALLEQGQLVDISTVLLLFAQDWSKKQWLERWENWKEEHRPSLSSPVVLTYEEYSQQEEEADSSRWSFLLLGDIFQLSPTLWDKTLSLLEEVNCGYFLYGDQFFGDVLSTDCYYPTLENRVGQKGKRYTLLLPQNSPLEEFRQELREILYDYTHKQEQLLAFMESFPNTETDFSIISPSEGTSTLLLCESKGDSLLTSAKLHQKRINHKIHRQTELHPPLHRWLGDVFWDYCPEEMTEESFLLRYLARVEHTPDYAKALYQHLLELSSSPSNVLHKGELLRYFQEQEGEYPSFLLVPESKGLEVATLTEAQGRGFDVVYQQVSGESPITYGTVQGFYQSLCLCKRKFTRMVTPVRSHPVIFHKSTANRVFACTKKYRAETCTYISLGFGKDIKPLSYLSDSPYSLQEYISTQIQPHHKIELVLEGNSYSVIHIRKRGGDKRQIGILSAEGFAHVLNAIQVRKEFRLPKQLHNLFVSHITTIPRAVNEQVPHETFQQSSFWLGIEIGGFAKIGKN